MSRLSRLGCRPSQGNQVTDDQAMDFIQMIPECGCWIWLGSVKTGGYGYVMRDGKRISMHRLSWARFRGPIPDGLFVLHKCDVTSCINPDHLFIGTATDNNHDMCRKGRLVNPRGDHHVSTKISDADVKTIFQSKDKTKTLMAKYGVSRWRIQSIRRGDRACLGATYKKGTP